jgi:hypothetical protein
MRALVVETFLHHLPIGAGWMEGLKELGHEAYALPSHMYNINDIDEPMDIVMFIGTHTFTHTDLIKYKNKWPETKVVVVCSGFDKEYLNIREYVDLWVEHTYKHDIIDDIFNSEGMKIAHIPLATSEKTFYNTNIEDKPYDVSFIGQFGNNGHGHRDEDIYLYPIMKLPIKGFWSGFNGYPQVHASNLINIYNNTKVNINFHYPYQKKQSDQTSDSIDFNSRVFDIAITKNFQLCDHPHILEFFDEGIGYADKHEWTDMFNYYLHNEEARIEKANKAYDICKENHTWKSRMLTLTNIINNL